MPCRQRLVLTIEADTREECIASVGRWAVQELGEHPAAATTPSNSTTGRITWTAMPVCDGCGKPIKGNWQVVKRDGLPELTYHKGCRPKPVSTPHQRENEHG